jgi:hypothetical protein
VGVPTADDHIRLLEAYFDVDGLTEYVAELAADPRPLRSLEAAVRDEPAFRTKRWGSVFELGLFRIVLHVLARRLVGRAFVETGVLHGITTSFILDGLRRGGSGTLVSIDLPSYFETGPANADGYDDTLPQGREPGWVIPSEGRDRWRLVIGPSLEELPAVLAEHAPIDVFLHDSEHTYETMTGEMELAWDALRPDGALVCDNLEASAAFTDFSRRVGRSPLLLPEGLGGLADVPRFGVLRR